MSIRVRVPASTSNLGSGFDCFGLALQLYLNVKIAESEDALVIQAAGEGSEVLPKDDRNLTYKAIQRVHEEVGRHLGPLKITTENQIPISRGLGSSGAAVIAGLVAGRTLVGADISNNRLLELACEFEGHPENAAASLFGGLSINCTDGDRIITHRLRIERDLQAVLLIPDVEIVTEEARRLLPKSLPHEDAVYNLQRSAAVAYAFATGDYTDLRCAMQDRLHQPYRKKLLPFYDLVESAGYANAALGVSISGSGSAILGFTLRQNGERLKNAWEECSRKEGLSAQVVELEVDNDGARVFEST